MADGGVGEAALLGSVIGGGTSLLTGGNPLKGALLGGVGGGLGTSLFGAESGLFSNPGAIAGTQAGATSLGIDALAPGGTQALGSALGTSELNATQQQLLSSMMSGTPITDQATLEGVQGLPQDQIQQVQDIAANQSQFSTAAANQLAGMGSAATPGLGYQALNWIQDNPKTAAALGLGGYTAYNLLTGKGNNYLAPYTPVSAGSMGLGGTLAAGYRPTRPMAAGGATTPTTSSTTAAAPVSDTVPYTPTSWGGVVPSTGVMPSDLKASTTSGSPLTMAQLQNMAAQYGYSLPNISGVSGTTTLAGGGIASLPNNISYPQGQIQSASYATPTQMPTSAQQVRQYGMSPVMMADGGQAQYDPYSEIQQQYMMSRLSGMPQVDPTASAKGGKINGNLGSYSDGGQMLQGPGDGMSDSIPADIAGKQPARLADGEFVVPADVVSGLGNGSTDAGAKHLYGMMDRVRKARTGTTKQGKQINPTKHLPA